MNDENPDHPSGEEPVPEKPRRKHPGGRPSSITLETISKLEQAFANGCNDQQACFFADIWPASFYQYQKKHPEFLERKKALRSRPGLIAKWSLNRNMAKDGWLALKYLERTEADEYGDKQVQTAPTINVSILFEKKVINYLSENPEAEVHLMKISKFLREPDGPEQAHV